MARSQHAGHNDAVLTDAECEELAAREARIEGRNRGNDEDLKAIRDGRLYRADYSAFEDYCRERWGFGRHYVNRLIAAAEAKEALVPIGTTMPANEGQIRPLTLLKTPEAQREAWQEAVATATEGKVTGKHVAATVARLFPRSPEGGTQYPKASAVEEVTFTGTTEAEDAATEQEGGETEEGADNSPAAFLAKQKNSPNTNQIRASMADLMAAMSRYSGEEVGNKARVGLTKASRIDEQKHVLLLSEWLVIYANTVGGETEEEDDGEANHYVAPNVSGFTNGLMAMWRVAEKHTPAEVAERAKAGATKASWIDEKRTVSSLIAWLQEYAQA